jgi:hypothetical protein
MGDTFTARGMTLTNCSNNVSLMLKILTIN